MDTSAYTIHQHICNLLYWRYSQWYQVGKQQAHLSDVITSRKLHTEDMLYIYLGLISMSSHDIAIHAIAPSLFVARRVEAIDFDPWVITMYMRQWVVLYTVDILCQSFCTQILCQSFCMYACMYELMYIYVCMRVCIYMHVYTYTCLFDGAWGLWR